VQLVDVFDIRRRSQVIEQALHRLSGDELEAACRMSPISGASTWEKVTTVSDGLSDEAW
jgi:hypothetical protein